MKKQYMIPTTDVVKIESQQIMAGSPGLGGGDYSGGGILSSEDDGMEFLKSELGLEEFPFQQ